MKDTVDCELPLGVLGTVAHRVFVKRNWNPFLIFATNF